MPLGLVLMDPATTPPPTQSVPSWLQALQRVAASALPAIQQAALAARGGNPVAVEASPPVVAQQSMFPGVKNEHLLLGLGAVAAYFFFRGRQ